MADNFFPGTKHDFFSEEKKTSNERNKLVSAETWREQRQNPWYVTKVCGLVMKRKICISF